MNKLLIYAILCMSIIIFIGYYVLTPTEYLMKNCNDDLFPIFSIIILFLAYVFMICFGLLCIMMLL